MQSSKKLTIKAILEPFLSDVGNVTLCKACGKQGTKNMTRFLHHFLGCSEANSAEAIEAKQILRQRISKKVYARDYSFASFTTTVSVNSDSLGESSRSSNNPVPDTSNTTRKTRRSASDLSSLPQGAYSDLEKLYAKAFYLNSINFNVTENPTWISLFSLLKPTFHLPSKNELNGRLLNEVFDEINEKTKISVSEAAYCCIAIDGWSNIRQEPIMNILVTTPKPLIVDYIESSCDSKRPVNMASKVKRVLEEVGVNKVVGIITDNASKTPEMADILRSNYNRLTFVVCTEYLLHVLCNDLLELTCFKQLQDDFRAIVAEVNCSEIKREVLRHEMEKFQKSTDIAYLPFISDIRTRCHTLYESLKRIRNMRRVLLNVGVDNVKQIVMGMKDRNFWTYAEVFCNIYFPIFECIQKVETEECCIADVPLIWKRVVDNASSSMSEAQISHRDSQDIMNVVNKYANVSLHNDCILLSNLLHPCYRGNSLSDDQQQRAFEFITQYATSLKYTVEDVLTIHDYLNKSGFFGIEIMKECNDPMLWWRTVGGYSKYKALSDIALRVLSIPANTGVRRFPHSNLNTDEISEKTMDNQTRAKFIAVRNNLRSFEPSVEESHANNKSEDQNSDNDMKNNDCFITAEVDLPPELGCDLETRQCVFNTSYD